jgi:hypothetical protein
MLGRSVVPAAVEYVPSCRGAVGFALWSSTPAFVPLIGSLSFFRLAWAAWRLHLEGAYAWFDVIVCMVAVSNTSVRD